VSDLATGAKRRRASRRARRRPTPFGAIIAALVLLVGSAGTVVFAQLAANGKAPWVSTALSAAAIATTVLAVALRRRP
jgi:hypothetical protein